MITRLKIESLSHEGRGITHYDGKVAFVTDALPDEIVDIKIIKETKSYLESIVTKYHKLSKIRKQSPCPYYKTCGGCQLGHLDYEDQLAFKVNKLNNILKKYSNIKGAIKVIPSKFDYYYRNKITLKVINYEWGYYSFKTHKFISIAECLLAKKSINEIFKFKEYFNFKNGEITLRSNYNNEIMIVINTKEKYKIDYEELKGKIKLLGIIVNEKLIYGQDKFIEKIQNKLFEVNYNSFFQVNLDVLSEVFTILNNSLYENVLDLYCGVGTLGLALNFNRLFGIENNKESVINALTNAKMNKKNNTYYLIGDSSKINEIKEHIDTIIIDPPRSGMNNKTLNNILNKNIENIIYMSCDPMTLGRDLNILKEKYKIAEIYLLDMFPNTYHIECITMLTQKVINRK